MSRRPRALAAALIALLSVGCSGELDPTDPADAYLMFRDALLSGEGEAVWARLDPSSRAYFEEAHGNLIEMSTTIERYLPAADHRIAKRQSGVVLLREARDGRALFLKLFTPASLPVSDAHMLGSEPESLVVSEDGAEAKVTTMGGQDFVLAKGEGEQWFVKLLDSTPVVARATGWIEANRSALRQTVDELIAEELAEREAVLAELFEL